MERVSAQEAAIGEGVGGQGWPGGEGEGEVVVAGGGGVGKVDELIEDVAGEGQGSGDPEEAGFEGDAEAGEEVAAGDEPAAVGVGRGVGAGSDRHRHQGCLKGGAAEEFDDRGADAGCVDDERAVRARRVAGLDGPAGLAGEGAREAGGRAGGGRGHGGRDSRDEGQVGQAERVANGRAEDEAEFGKGLVGDGIGASQGNGEALEEDEGGGVAAAAEVEAEEQVRFGVGTGGEGRFVEEGSHGMARVNCKARGWPRQGAVRAGCGEVFWMERVAGTGKGRSGVTERTGEGNPGLVSDPAQAQGENGV